MCVLQVHLESCPFKLVPCTNVYCYTTVQRRNLKRHVTIKCPWRILECDHCSEPHPECQMQVDIAIVITINNYFYCIFRNGTLLTNEVFTDKLFLLTERARFKYFFYSINCPRESKVYVPIYICK